MADKKQNNDGGQVLSDIAKQIKVSQVAEKTYPPVHLWNPDFCGSINMRIAPDGSWYYMDTPISRPAMVKLFSTVLRKDDDDYFLVTPVEKLAIIVEDVPFFVVRCERTGAGKDQVLSFETLTDDMVIADKDHAIRVEIDEKSGEPSPYIHIRGGMEGRINRAVYYELVALAEPMQGNDNTYGVWSSGMFFPIGQVDGDEDEA
jgi:hypothetical protein